MNELCPLVSVIIPTRNRCELVCRAIHSALKQTYSHLEIIVVLDGPDDVTARKLQKIEDIRVRAIVLPENVGGSESRNAGIRAAKGKYVALLDDDDAWFPDKLEKQTRLAEQCDSDECLVVTRYLRIQEGHSDEVWPVRLPGKHEALSEFIFSSRCGFQTPVFFAPRELMLKIPFTYGLKKHQDWDWLLRAASRPNFKLLIVDEVLAKVTVWTRKDSGISQHPDWEFSRKWATEAMQENLMTRKAYGLFLTKVCLPSARSQSASLKDLLTVFHLLLLVGAPTFVTVVDALEVIAFPIGLRQWLRDTRISDIIRGAYVASRFRCRSAAKSL